MLPPRPRSDHIPPLQASLPTTIPHHKKLDHRTPTGHLLRNIFASVAEYEWEMIREWVVAGLRNAKARGKQIGRPRAVPNRLRIEQLRGEGLSRREIARKINLPKSTVYQYRMLAQNPSAAATCSGPPHVSGRSGSLAGLSLMIGNLDCPSPQASRRVQITGCNLHQQ